VNPVHGQGDPAAGTLLVTVGQSLPAGKSKRELPPVGGSKPLEAGVGIDTSDPEIRYRTILEWNEALELDTDSRARAQRLCEPELFDAEQDGRTRAHGEYVETEWPLISEEYPEIATALREELCVSRGSSCVRAVRRLRHRRHHSPMWVA